MSIDLTNVAKMLFGAPKEKSDAWVAKADTAAINKHIKLNYPRFAAVLPYRYYWKEKDVFINQHSVGVGFEISVCCGADEKLVNSLSDILRHRIPDEMDVQFIFYGSNQVGPIIDNAYSRMLKNANRDADLCKASIAYYHKAAKSGFKNKMNLPTALREYRLFVFISKSASQGYSDELARDLESVRENFSVELAALGIDFTSLNLDRFLNTVFPWINPDIQNIYPPKIKHEEYTGLNEQLVDKSFELIHDQERLTVEVSGREGERTLTKITNLSIRSLPDEFCLWEGPDNFFNVFRSSQAIKCPFLISMNMRLVPQAQAKSKSQSMYLGMEKKAKSVYAKYISGTQEAAAEWKKIRDELASDTIRLANIFFNLVLFSNDGEEKRDESSAISSYRYNGIEIFNTKYMQLQSYLATLPFMMSEGMFHDLNIAGRLKTVTTWNLANLLPVVADYKMCRDGVLLSSFRNQINFFDPFSSNLPTANYNIAVAATSGAGKSFLVQNILSDTLNKGGRCFVIDLGHSYRKFCEIVGGTYLEYQSLKLNPFTNVTDINEVSEQIRDLLSVLASPAGALSEVQEEYLRQAVMLTWKRHNTKSNIDTVIQELKIINQERQDGRIYDLITLLDKYSTTGPYPSIFNEYSNIAPDSNFVVLELGDLENKPDLLKGALFALILNIEQQMYQSPRNQPKMAVIDEVWRFLSGDNKAAARFIEKGFRTGRRHFGSFVTISQSIEDYQKSDEAKACWNCSDIKIIMLQNAKAFDDFLLTHKDYFNPYTASLIKQFREAKTNGFSEFMLQLGKVQTFCRLFVDPFSRVMFSSSGNEFAAVSNYQKQGFSLNESILKVAQENYGDEF